MSIAGLVLAAGGGTRFGGPKAVVEIDGERLVDRAVRLVRDGGCSPVVVVAGAVSVDVPGAAVVHNPRWRTGMGSSLRTGLSSMPADAAAVVVVLVDMPGLLAEGVRRVVQAFRDGSGLVIATYGGRRSHPVLLGRTHWPGIIDTVRGDSGARAYLAGRADVTEVDCTDAGDPFDVDEPADLLRGTSPSDPS